MALSMFLRSPVCLNRAFSQQISRLATQPGYVQKAVQKCLPVATTTLQEKSTKPTFDAARQLATSPTRLSGVVDEKPHDHARLWVIEKVTTALMIPLIPAALMMPNKILDCAVAILITAHSFWGLEAIAVDYVRASIFGPIIPKIAIGLVYAISIATLGGLFYVISHDIGIANTVRSFWAIKSEKS